MSSLAEAYVRLRPDTSSVGSEIERGLVAPAGAAGKKAGKEAGKGIHSGLSGAISGLAAGFAGTAIFGFLKDSVNEAREAAQALRLTEAVIKSTGGAAGLTAEDVHGLAEKLGQLDGVQGDVIQSGENVLLTFTNIKNQSGAGNDIFSQATQSALNLSAVMHQDLQTSFVQIGKALNDPVKGVTALSRAGVSFDATQKAQIKNMVKHNNLLGAQKMILKELDVEGKGAAAAATSPAAKATVAWHDFKEEIGTKLLPVIGQLIGAIMPLLPAIEQIVGAIVDFIVHNKILTGIIIGVAAAIWLVNIAMALSPVTWIILGIVALVVVLVYCWTHFRIFRVIIEGAWHGILVGAIAVKNFFTRQIPEAFEFVRHAVVDRFDKAVTYVKGVPGRIWGFFSALPGKFLGLGSDIVHGIIRGIESMLGALASTAANAAKSALNAAKNFLGISSPSRVFAEQVGAPSAAGIVAGMRSGLPAVTAAGQASARALLPATQAANRAQSGAELLAETRRTNELLAGLRLVVNADGLALSVRSGEKRLRYAG